MIKKALLIIITFSLLLAKDPKVTVTVDQNRIYEGDSIKLKVAVENGGSIPEVDLTKIKDFQIVSGPNQESNLQWINGKMSSTQSLSYILIPRKKGELIIPSLMIKVDDKTYKSQKIRITIYERGNQTNSVDGLKEEKYYLEATVDNFSPSRGEQITVIYTLYTRDDITGFDIKEEPRYKGFWTQEIYSPRNLQLREVRKNKVRWYSATIKKVALFPTTSGELEIEPMLATIGIRIQDKSQRSFFSNMFTTSKNHTLRSNSVKINVNSLPESISGKISAAVGNWKVTSKISSTKVVQDEAVTFTIQIKGEGNLQAVDIQDISFPGELEIFEPQIKIEENPLRDKIAGIKTIDYVIIPRTSGKINIPSIELMYFDPSKKKWETSSTQPIRLDVLPNERKSFSSTGLTKEEIRMMGEDIRFSDQSDPHWKVRNTRIISNWFLVLLSFSLILFSLPHSIDIFQTQFHGTRKVRTVKKALKNSLQVLEDTYNTPISGYTAIQTSVNKFINDKVGSHVERSTREILEIVSKCTSLETNHYEKLSNILKRGDAARFSPISNIDMEDDLIQIKKLLTTINHVWI